MREVDELEELGATKAADHHVVHRGLDARRDVFGLGGGVEGMQKTHEVRTADITNQVDLVDGEPTLESGLDVRNVGEEEAQDAGVLLGLLELWMREAYSLAS